MSVGAKGLEDAVTGDGDEPVAPERVQITDRAGDRDRHVVDERGTLRRRRRDLPARCWSWSRIIRTRFTMPACWRTSAAATTRRWTSFGAASSASRSSRTGTAISGSSCSRSAGSRRRWRRSAGRSRSIPAHENAHNNLGVLQRLYGRLEDAEASYRAVIALNPNHPDVYLQPGRRDGPDRPGPGGAGGVLQGHYVETRATACASAPGDRVRGNRRNAEGDRGLRGVGAGTARTIRGRVMRSPPTPAGTCRRARSDAYVQKVFDDFAESFEAKLARLEYQAPSLVCEALAAVIATRRQVAGCARCRLRHRAVWTAAGARTHDG